MVRRDIESEEARVTEPKRVADIMTREPVCLHEEDNLGEIAQDMERYQFRHLPVVDGTKLVGLVSHRDLLRHTVSALEQAEVGRARNERLQQDTFVAHVMTRDPRTVTEDDSVGQAARVIMEGHFGCAPVVDGDGTLVGIVTEHDLLQYLVGLLEA